MAKQVTDRESSAESVAAAADTHTDMRLRLGVMLARAMSQRPTQHAEDEAASFAAIDAAIEAIRKQLAGFEEIQTTATTVTNSGDKIRNRARIMADEMDKRMTMLVKHIGLLQLVKGSGAQ